MSRECWRQFIHIVRNFPHFSNENEQGDQDTIELTFNNLHVRSCHPDLSALEY